jgi:hypothetical protein
MPAVVPTMAVVTVAAVVPAAAVMAAAMVVVIDTAAKGQDAQGKGGERGEAPTGAVCGHRSFLS